MKLNTLFRLAVCGAFLILATSGFAATRLFILSGQSNMVGIDPDTSFTPVVKAAFPNDDIIVVKEAVSGKPISMWFPNGSIYKRLIDKVNAAIQGKPAPDTITFVWMQGEADANPNGQGDKYAELLTGLIAQLRGDLKRKDTMVVIARISDFGLKETEKPNRPHWQQVRDAEEKVAAADPLAAWIDTDDLNGPNDALHYLKKGWQALGERFAQKAIELIKKHPGLSLTSSSGNIHVSSRGDFDTPHEREMRGEMPPPAESIRTVRPQGEIGLPQNGK